MAPHIQRTVLSTADIARLFNVTETTVKRWADEGTLKCQKTPGGHRKFDMKNVVEFAEKNHFEPVGALTIPEEDRLAQRIRLAVLGRDCDELVTAFVEKALSPDKTDLFLFLSYLYEHRFQLWEIYDNVLRPGMAEIGERWAHGDIGVHHEHRASYETLDALAKLQAHIRIKPPSGRSVLCACVGDELHEIGLRCASYLFESEGWETCYLGARMPLEAILGAIKEVHPDVVCLSVTYSVQPGVRSQDLEQIVHRAREAGCRVLLGGRLAHSVMLDGGLLDRVPSSSKELLEYVLEFGEAAEKHAGRNGG